MDQYKLYVDNSAELFNYNTVVYILISTFEITWNIIPKRSPITSVEERIFNLYSCLIFNICRQHNAIMLCMLDQFLA